MDKRSSLRTAQGLHTLDSRIGQAMVVLAEPAGGGRGQVLTWERREKDWLAVFPAMPAVIGRNGFAPPGEKAEGDGRSPSGTFPLGTAFGYGPSVPTKLAYRQATENDYWVDDPASPQYNQWVTGMPQANSFERMKRDDDLYRYGIVIEYNRPATVRGEGSAIFMHVWRGPDSPTSGCVALSPENLLKILGWLDRSRNPVIVLGGTRGLAP